jgi:glutamate--cysteine ligase
LIPVTDDDRSSPVRPQILRAGFNRDFVRDAVPTFEPGGQVELSPSPRPTAEALVRDLRSLIARTRRIAHDRGVRLLSAGTNLYHSCAEVALCTPTPRYLALQEMFDRVGPAGRRMMRLTASLQVTVDVLPGSAGREQWLVANLAGAPLAAAFAAAASQT